MNNDLDNFMRQVSDTYLYEMLMTIFNRLFPKDSVFIPILQLTKKYGMPVKNVVPFIQELGEWCKNNMNDSDNNPLSDNDRQSLYDMLSHSGFMTIGFDPSDRGDDDEKH